MKRPMVPAHEAGGAAPLAAPADAPAAPRPSSRGSNARSTPTAPPPPLPRLLCLHGGRQSADLFRSRLRGLTTRCATLADFVFVDAPHEVPLNEGDEPTMPAERRQGEGEEHPQGEEHALCWYAGPRGEGARESLEALEAVWRSAPPFAGVVGFSQGAAAALAIGARPARFPGVRALLVGGAPEGPPADAWGPGRRAVGRGVRSLHVYSEKDPLVRAAESAEHARACGEGAEVYTHDKGHALPCRAADVDVYEAFLRAALGGEGRGGGEGGGARGTEGEAPRGEGKAAGRGSASATLGGRAAKRAGKQGGGRGRERGGGKGGGSGGEGGVREKGEERAVECAAPPPSVAEACAPFGGVESDGAGRQLSGEEAEAWAEELQALQAIYAADLLLDEGSASPDDLIAAAASGQLAGPPLSCSFSVLLDGGGVDADALPPGAVHLACALAPGYPFGGVAPTFELRHTLLSHQLPAMGAAAVAREARETSEALLAAGETSVIFAAVGAANDALARGVWRGAAAAAAEESSSDEEAAEDEMDAQTRKLLVRQMTAEAIERAAREAPLSLLGVAESAAAEGAPQSLKGAWHFRVGLVGKPSAGKSTLFNALTRAGLDLSVSTAAAKVGATPFTTIQPNIGPALWAAPAAVEPEAFVRRRAHTSYGRAADGRRLLPCTLIDVAGLVPGAYEGRGKGNQFLHDLTTADVLVHVVDASGTTDESGNPTAAAFDEAAAREACGAPELEIEWVRAEIHQWVYENVRAKRRAWRKRPHKLPAMFSGYGAMPTLVDGALRRARGAAEGAAAEGTDVRLQRAAAAADHVAAAAMAAGHSDAELHRLVAHFVAARWPIMIALNKADHHSAAAHIARCRQLHPHRPMVPCSAASEVALLAASGGCGYVPGAAEVVGEGGGVELERARRMLLHWGSTGCLDVLSAAVALRPPTIVFPVASTLTLAPLGAAPAPPHSAAGASASPLRDALVLKPLATVGDAFEACKRLSPPLLAGEFVRAEARQVSSWQEESTEQKVQAAAPRPVLVRREELATSKGAILRIQTNRKPQWQAQFNRDRQQAAAIPLV
ncbi:hypothetical protein AB1Y20_009245 [Prymnesium parvum]|uniref:OBG-type G domain-containing protein n=1 Tax=Prymnesium parvum TaxID=97485 RepID=A0AB34K1L2_PRYPA